MEQTLTELEAPLQPIAPPTDGYLNQVPLSVIGIEGYPAPYVPITPTERDVRKSCLPRVAHGLLVFLISSGAIFDPRFYSNLWIDVKIFTIRYDTTLSSMCVRLVPE